MKRILHLASALIFLSQFLFSQVEIRDTSITWQHHRFELDDENGMGSYSTSDTDIQQVVYANSKVIENEFIKLVVVPEYGGRVLSFQYKPTGYEYLYQSECGSAYGIGDGNFYYDWLMVWGGIFPTFPEPEHGKTWLLPWKYTLIKETADTVIIQMEFTDSTEYSSTPSKFSKGITGITCKIDVGVYSGSSLWDFNVTLINNKTSGVNYEYWTCTSLTPGSEPVNTGSPLNSEFIVPFTQYEAGWSPGSWIGDYGTLYDMAKIDYLSKWNDMGIAYGHNLNDNYWGVINHDNSEGVMRISENVETPGMKFWSWGKDNIDNDLFDYSNGGKDNYIELWAGVSDAFFESASLSGNETKSWVESYVPTTGISSIGDINRIGVAEIVWNEQEQNLSYNLNTFRPSENYEIALELSGNNSYSITDKTIDNNPLGISESFSLEDFDVANGNYDVTLSLMDSDRNIVLEVEENISVQPVSGIISKGALTKAGINIQVVDRNRIQILFSDANKYTIRLIDSSGRIVENLRTSGSEFEMTIHNQGIYILQIAGTGGMINEKILIQ